VEGSLERVALECHVCVREEELVSVFFEKEFVTVERRCHFHATKKREKSVQ
jgi:hypothetical protein